MKILSSVITTNILCLLLVAGLIYLVIRKQNIDLATGQIKSTISFKKASPTQIPKI